MAAVLSTTVNNTHFMQVLWTTVVNLGNYSRPKALANLTHVGEDYKFESKVYRFLFVCLCACVCIQKPEFCCYLGQRTNWSLDYVYWTELTTTFSLYLNAVDHKLKLSHTLTWSQLSLSIGTGIEPPSASSQVESTESVASSKIKEVKVIRSLYNATIVCAGL